MKATELRIGNHILNRRNKLVIVDIHVITMLKNWEDLKYSKTPPFKPITLTEEILLKAGFEKDNSGYELGHPDYCEWCQKEFPIIGELCQSSDKSYLFDTDTDTLRIMYLHDLQNLYYALKHEELEIKL